LNTTSSSSLLPEPPATEPVVPRHIAVIMDGNGRWAAERRLPRVEGHRRGASAVRAVTTACAELGVECLTLFAFSTENWKRPREEVDALFHLLEHFLALELPVLHQNNIQLRAIGRLQDLPATARTALDAAIRDTAANSAMTLVLAINYSGRTELEDAIRNLCREVRDGRLDPEEFTQADLQRHLYTAEWPDPDLLIRTSGEMRLSNFLLWQLSYTELYVTPKLWPDFGETDLHAALAEFKCRRRRYGGL
jgi:undecaprenyl diphosphate synthase